MKDSLKVSLNSIVCKEPSHKENFCFALCIDPNCQAKNKLLCIDCLFQFHPKHSIIKLEDVEEQINKKIASSKPKDEEQSQIYNNIKSEEEKIQNEIDELKRTMNRIFETKANDFLGSFKAKMDELKLIESNQEISSLFNNSVYPPVNEKDTVKFGELLSEFYQKQEEIKEDNEKKSTLEIVKKFIEEFDCNLKAYFKKENDTLAQFFSISFLNSAFLPDEHFINFEWDTKVFKDYGFYYKISENLKRLSKKLADGKITAALSKNVLEYKKNYQIELELSSKKGGDTFLGFGYETIGEFCSGKFPGVYCVSNSGIFENGKKTNPKEVKDGNIVTFEIFLGQKKKCNILIDGELAHSCSVNLEEKDIYFFASFRNVDTSVIVKNFRYIEDK